MAVISWSVWALAPKRRFKSKVEVEAYHPGNVETFEKLEVWQKAQALSIHVYRLLAGCRDWGFRDQMTRSANSIADNIAEGAERPGRAEFKLFLGYAKGSAGETRSQALRGLELGYFSEHEGRAMVTELREISRMLHGLIKSLDH